MLNLDCTIFKFHTFLGTENLALGLQRLKETWLPWLWPFDLRQTSCYFATLLKVSGICQLFKCVTLGSLKSWKMWKEERNTSWKNADTTHEILMSHVHVEIWNTAMTSHLNCLCKMCIGFYNISELNEEALKSLRVMFLEFWRKKWNIILKLVYLHKANNFSCNAIYRTGPQAA